MVESKIARSYVNESENTWINGYEPIEHHIASGLCVFLFDRTEWFYLNAILLELL